MNFWALFFRVLRHRPTKALGALYWQLTGRKVRARNRLRVAGVDLPFAYSWWIANNEKTAGLADEIEGMISAWKWRPRFSILLHGEPGSPELLERSIQSVQRQTYRSWELLERPKASLQHCVAGAQGDFVVPLRIGDVLSECALFRLGSALQHHENVSIVYGDQDELDQRCQRSRPWFKPRWNRELFLAQDYISEAAAIEIDLARHAAAEAANTDEFTFLAACRSTGSIVHVAYVLCHVAAHHRDDQGERLRAVNRYVADLGATCSPGPFGTIKVEWPLPSELPLVTVIVPTRDKLELLRPCVESVLQKTDYPNFEILIVDNASDEDRTMKYLAGIAEIPNIQVLRYDNAFNYSAINNFAATQAAGSFLCLLNNDTEVAGPSWLTELMRYAVRPDIGAAGAKLLYDDGSIQHAGVVVGIGGAAGHAHRFLPGHDPGYFCMPHIAQFVSAVTGACLVVEKSKFEAVGGLDEEELPVAFNDVDLCLKLELAGWRNVYVPHAVLVHHESRSRGSDMARQHYNRYLRELGVLQKRWGTATYDDPLHNPNLDRCSETFIFTL